MDEEFPEKVQWVVDLMKDQDLNKRMAEKIWRATQPDSGFGKKFSDVDAADQNGFKRQASQALDAVLSHAIVQSLDSVRSMPEPTKEYARKLIDGPKPPPYEYPDMESPQVPLRDSDSITRDLREEIKDFQERNPK